MPVAVFADRVSWTDLYQFELFTAEVRHAGKFCSKPREDRVVRGEGGGGHVLDQHFALTTPNLV